MHHLRNDKTWKFGDRGEPTPSQVWVAVMNRRNSASERRRHLQDAGLAAYREIVAAEIDSEVRIPDGLIVREDPDFDAKRFRRTDDGVTLITGPMIEKLRQ